MIANVKQIKITDDAFLDVTCEEWHDSADKYRTRFFGQVARGRPFGNWGSGPWDRAVPSREQIAKAVSDEIREYAVRVDSVQPDGGWKTDIDLASPIFHFERAVPPAPTEAPDA